MRIGPLIPAFFQGSSFLRQIGAADAFENLNLAQGKASAGELSLLKLASFGLRASDRDKLQISAADKFLSGGAFNDLDDAQLHVAVLVDSIRQLASKPNGSGAEKARRQAQVDAALAEIGRLTGSEIRFGGSANAAIAGINQQQIAQANVISLSPFADLTITGEVTQNAQPARLTILGAAGSTAADSASFVLQGEAGEASFQITQGEALADVAQRINARSTAIGARARVKGDTLVIESVSVGPQAGVRLRQLSGGVSSVSGVNDAQIANFAVVTQQGGGSETISGSVTSTAGQALVRYLGDQAGVVAGTATFRLTGELGSATISITQGESLDDVASRVNAASDETGVSVSVVGDELQFVSQSQGSAAFVQIEVLDLHEQIDTTGVNAAQVESFGVVAIDAGAQQTLSGEVLQSAAAAELTLRVASGGAVVDNAVFQITGVDGSVQFAIAAGESLADVADRINAQTANTGVAASISGDDVLLRSVDLGGSALIEAALIDIDHEINVSGVNPAQISDFQVLAFTDGAQQTLSGSITQAADVAELTFTGSFGLVGTSSTFTLSGSLGSVNITTTPVQSLSNLAAQINANSHLTGVAASVSGNTLTLNSSGVGSAATIAVNVTSGSFNVQGGNGDGTANGIDAEAVINGQAVTASGNDFSFSDALGDYAFTVVGGFTGALDEVAIDSVAGFFEVSGGNGDGTANGVDALAEINGQQLSSADNRFTVTTAVGEFDLQFAAGFTGAFDAITVTSTLDEFELAGADENGRAAGVDAVATINGTQLTGVGNQFSFTGETGSFSIEFVDGFTGSFDSITATSAAAQLDILGGDKNGAAQGRDARAIINGRLLTGDGLNFAIQGQGVEVELQLAPDFVGVLDEVRIRTRVISPADSSIGFADSPKSLAQAVEPLLQFGSGGSLVVGRATAEAARSAALDVHRRLADVQPNSERRPGQFDPLVSQASPALDAAQLLSRRLNNLAQLRPATLQAAIDWAASANRRQIALQRLSN